MEQFIAPNWIVYKRSDGSYVYANTIDNRHQKEIPYDTKAQREYDEYRLKHGYAYSGEWESSVDNIGMRIFVNINTKERTYYRPPNFTFNKHIKEYEKKRCKLSKVVYESEEPNCDDE